RDLHSFPTRRSSDLYDCDSCGGDGLITCDEYECNGKHEWQCDECIGEGKVACSKCEGEGWVTCRGWSGCGGSGKVKKTVRLSNGDRKSTRLNSSHVK